LARLKPAAPKKPSFNGVQRQAIRSTATQQRRLEATWQQAACYIVVAVPAAAAILPADWLLLADAPGERA
jgi:hypothetical protein